MASLAPIVSYMTHTLVTHMTLCLLVDNVHIHKSFTGSCKDEEYRCGDSSCIDVRGRCDGVRDCEDGADEVDCGQ